MTTETMRDLIPATHRANLQAYADYWESVKAIEIKSQGDYDRALEVCAKLKMNTNQLEADRKALGKPHKEKVDYINAEYKRVRDGLANGETQLKRAMGRWYAEEQRKIAEANAKAEAEAEEKRRKEQEKAQAEIDKAQRYREQGREDLADKATARAETALDRAESTVADVRVSQTKGKGASFQTVYVAEVTDLRAFLEHTIKTQPLYLAHVSVDLKPFEAMQKQYEGRLEVPGIAFRKEVRTAVRARR